MIFFNSNFLSKRRLAFISLVCLALFLMIGVYAGQGLARDARNMSASNKTIIHHQKTPPKIDRLSGSNAINTSVAVSKKYYSPGAEVAYIVNRSAFADGVIASSMKTYGPILYTNTDSLPSAVATELSRLKPKKVIVIGGSVVVSDPVFSRIKQTIPASSTLQRLQGSNRYQTAVNVSRADYPHGSDTVYIANGTAYSDALIATQQETSGPLLYSSATSIRSSVIDEIKRLKAKRVVILGGTPVVSQAVANTIDKSTNASVSRISGSNRYNTAAALSKQLYPNGSSQVFISHGTAYADSILIGSIPSKGSMLYVSDRITEATMTELQRLNANSATIIGGVVRVTNPLAKQVQQIISGAQVKQRVAQGVSYIVIAHPDDEIASWAIAESSSYPVFILATQGEASYYCGSYGGRGSSLCKLMRVNSWHKFLDNYYTVSDHGMQPGGFQLFKGSDSARLVFDLGDGNLSASEVTHAINQARSVNYGIAQENYLISGNYWDDRRDPSCPTEKGAYLCGLYDHLDHRTAYNAVAAYPYPNKMSFHGSYNPKVTAGVVMDKQRFDSMLACPGGTYNQAYAWLSPPCWTRENSLWNHWQWIREF